MARKKFDISLLPPAPDFHFERLLWEERVQFVAGIDEAGRGALAGPVYAAAVIFPVPKSTSPEEKQGMPPNGSLETKLAGLNDSKKLTASQREYWAEQLPNLVTGYAVGFATSIEIDRFGILPATRLAIRRALHQLDPVPQHLLVDFIKLTHNTTPQTSLTKGDAISLSIAAASIFAKTSRDAFMQQLDRQYPGYGFAVHKGYGTPQHLKAIDELGPCPEHRRSFSPLKPRLL